MAFLEGSVNSFRGFSAGLLGPMYTVSWQCECVEEAVDFMTDRKQRTSSGLGTTFKGTP